MRKTENGSLIDSKFKIKNYFQRCFQNKMRSIVCIKFKSIIAGLLYIKLILEIIRYLFD